MNILNKNCVIKKLTLSLNKSGGRNSTGHITVHHRGQGAKYRYRLIDFNRTIKDIPAKVRRIEYDPNRNAYIALICYKNSVLSYIIAADGLKVNDIILNNTTQNYVVNYSLSHSLPLEKFYVGSLLHSIEYFPQFGSKIARSAGSFCQFLKKINEDYILLRLKSKEYRMFYKSVWASFGIVSNKLYKFEKQYKAGQTRYLGIKPTVRGEAKNPVDHPHGGNTSGGRHPRTPWGKLTKGVKTRNLRKITNSLIFKTRHV